MSGSISPDWHVVPTGAGPGSFYILAIARMLSLVSRPGTRFKVAAATSDEIDHAFRAPRLGVGIGVSFDKAGGFEMRMLRSHFLALLFGLMALAGQTARADDPCGRWCGTWCSYTNGHTGRIHAHVCPCDNCTYRVRFTGTFLGVVPFTYAVPMTVTGQGADGTTYLSGQACLPLFGDFCCNAAVKGCCFTASYNSTKDQGQFSMQR